MIICFRSPQSKITDTVIKSSDRMPQVGTAMRNHESWFESDGLRRYRCVDSLPNLLRNQEISIHSHRCNILCRNLHTGSRRLEQISRTGALFKGVVAMYTYRVDIQWSGALVRGSNHHKSPSASMEKIGTADNVHYALILHRTDLFFTNDSSLATNVTSFEVSKLAVWRRCCTARC